MPLSPLLCLLVENAPNLMLIVANEQRLIKSVLESVYIEETREEETHTQFVDDTNLIFEAKMESITCALEILRQLGRASGLFVKEVGLKVVLISSNPLPNELLALDWVWERADDPSKLLGFFIGDGLATHKMVEYLSNALEDHLKHAQKGLYVLVLRVAIYNQLISCVMWYMLQLYPGDLAILDQFDKLVKEFTWSGKETKLRTRVNCCIITRAKDRGGLTLNSFRAHTTAIAGKFILWTVGEGDTTLQAILRGKIADLSKRRWGRRDFSWLISHDNIRPIGESHVWNNFAIQWISLKKHVQPRLLANWSERLMILLWTPH